jgi:hypothetical protein
MVFREWLANSGSKPSVEAVWRLAPTEEKAAQ